MFLDLAGLDKQQKLMIQSSIGNVRDFEKVADALVLQHPRIHLSEAKQRQVKTGPGKGKGKRRPKGKGKGRFHPFGKGKGKYNPQKAHLSV